MGRHCKNYDYCILINDTDIIVKLILLLDLFVAGRASSEICRTCKVRCSRLRLKLSHKPNTIFYTKNTFILDICLNNNIYLLYFSCEDILYKIIAIMQMNNTELNNNIVNKLTNGSINQITIKGIIYVIKKDKTKIFSLALKTYITNHFIELSKIIDNLSYQIINEKYKYYYIEDENLTYINNIKTFTNKKVSRTSRTSNNNNMEYKSIDLNNGYISNLLLEVNPSQWLDVNNINVVLDINSTSEQFNK